MSLTLDYEDKYRLWAALVQGAVDRIFVPTEESLAIGAAVSVQLAVPGIQTAIRGHVVGRRRRGERFAGGVYLRFTQEELDACRSSLGLAQAGSKTPGRRWPRVYRTLELRFKKPEVRGKCAAQNLSEAGMLVTCPAALFAGQRVEVALTLDDGQELPLAAEVVWVKPADELAGLRLVDVTPESSRKLADALKRMLQSTPRRTQHVVVVAEPDASFERVKDALSPLHAEAFAVHSGEDVISLTRWLHPSLVLLDVMMPSVDAVDVCRRMHADADLADIPIVFHADLDEARLHALADQAGATDYLPRQAGQDELTRVLGGYLKTKQGG
jgi:CheY-like chemotaxis protein